MLHAQQQAGLQIGCIAGGPSSSCSGFGSNCGRLLAGAAVSPAPAVKKLNLLAGCRHHVELCCASHRFCGRDLVLMLVAGLPVVCALILNFLCT